MSAPSALSHVLKGGVSTPGGAASAHRLSEERWRAEIAESYRRQHGVTVERIERASEAPALGSQPVEVLLQAAGGPVDSERWLVWWR